MPAGAHPDYAAIDVLAFVLGDSPSGRLYRALVETQLATAAGSQARQLREAGQLLQFTVVPVDKDLREVERVMNETVEGVVTEPVTEAEVTRAKAAVLNDINRSFNSSAGIALQLSEWGSMGDWRLFFLHRDRIEAVTAADVNRVAQAYLKSTNRTVGRFYPTQSPDRAEIPDAPDVVAMVSDYEGREAVAEGEAFDPSPSNVEARTIRYTLGNGLEVALLPKETRGDLAMVRLRLHFGDVQALAGRVTAGDLAGSMLMRGTQRLSRQDIQDELDRLQASGSVGGTATMGTGSFQTVRTNVAEVVRLMAELAREPSFPRTEFDLIKEQELTGLEQARSEPQVRAQIALARATQRWSAGHPSYTETIEESIESVRSTTLEESRAFYDEFWGPQSGNVVVVGDFDEAEVRAAIEESFGDWESPHGYERVATPFYDPPADEITIETPDKANAVFFAQQNLELRDTDPDYSALVIAGYMLGGGVLNSRLARRIRVQDGLSYGVQGGISGHPIDPSGSFFAFAIYAPENAGAVQAAFVEEMERVIADGFTQEELDAAKQGWLESRQLSRAQDSQLAAALSQALYFDRTMMFDADIEARVRGLTLGEVNQAVRDRIDLSKMTIVKAGDFANAPPIG
jgi:zinc protease